LRREIKRTRNRSKKEYKEVQGEGTDREEDDEAEGRDTDLFLIWLYFGCDGCGMVAYTDGAKGAKNAKKK
jgi:hypothetical protein